MGYRKGKGVNSDVPVNMFCGKDETEIEDNYNITKHSSVLAFIL